MTQTHSRRTAAIALTLLLITTAIWGGTFVVVHDVVRTEQVFSFLAWRFWIAAAALVLVRPRAALALPRAARGRGVALGCVLAVGYITQTYGLRYASASVSGFITGLFVVFTPLLTGPLLRRKIPRSAWAAAILATFGLALLSLHGFHVGKGEALTVVAALAFATHIVGLAAWSKPADAYGLTIWQLATTALICTIAAVPSGGLQAPHSAANWWAVAFLGIAATSFAFLAQTWAQAYLSPTRTAVILTMEPVFAGVFGVTVAGDPLTWRVALGGASIVGAMYVTELSPRVVEIPPHVDS